MHFSVLLSHFSSLSPQALILQYETKSIINITAKFYRKYEFQHYVAILRKKTTDHVHLNVGSYISKRPHMFHKQNLHNRKITHEMASSTKLFSSTFLLLSFLTSHYAIFVKENWLDNIQTNQKNYGVAVSDVNNDGRPDFIVAGYSGPNFVIVYDTSTRNVTNIAQEGSPFAALRDVPGNAIGKHV